MVDAGIPAMLRKLEALRAVYHTELPQRLDAIERCWAVVRCGDVAAAQLEEFQRLVHSLAGSAGTFGFTALGSVARELEQAINRLAAAAGSLGPQQQSIVDAGVASLRDCAREAPSPVDSPTAAPDHAMGDTENRLLYVIEDDQLQAEGMASQLSTFGWNVRQLPNATTAREALQRDVPAAVIVDVTLPEGLYAGPELISAIHASTQTRVAHVIVSSRWDWDSRLAAARSGADAYFVKPVDFAALNDRLDAITRRRQPQPYRVLIVDDTAILAEHYAQVLAAAGMEARTIEDPARLLDVLADFNPELVLMDLYMPTCTGIEAARVVRQDPKFTSLPIVFLSTESGRAQQLAAMQTGADDFLEKPINDGELVAAVSVRAERFRTLAALIRQDSLTGLLNHIAFKMQLEAEIARVQRSGAALAMAMLDIDHFKLVNDNYGHPVGDRVIRGLAQLLLKRLRKSDQVGRYGGEEFGVLMPDTSLDSAVRVIDSLREQFRQIRFIAAKDATFTCSFSAGVAAFSSGVDASSLIRATDEALYVAKRSGRDRVSAAAAQTKG